MLVAVASKNCALYDELEEYSPLDVTFQAIVSSISSWWWMELRRAQSIIYSKMCGTDKDLSKDSYNLKDGVDETCMSRLSKD
jgi:hypothetical protein